MVTYKVKSSWKCGPGLITLYKCWIWSLWLFGLFRIWFLGIKLMLFWASSKFTNIAHRNFRAIFSELVLSLSNQLAPSFRLLVLFLNTEVLEYFLRLLNFILFTLNDLLSYLLLFKFSLLIKRIHNLPKFVIVNHFATLCLYVYSCFSKEIVELLILALWNCLIIFTVVSEYIKVQKHLEMWWRGNGLILLNTTFWIVLYRV